MNSLPPPLMTSLFGAGAGVMLYAVIDDIIYDAHRLGPGAISTFPLLAGVMVGVALTALAH